MSKRELRKRVISNQSAVFVRSETTNDAFSSSKRIVKAGELFLSEGGFSESIYFLRGEMKPMLCVKNGANNANRREKTWKSTLGQPSSPELSVSTRSPSTAVDDIEEKM